MRLLKDNNIGLVLSSKKTDNELKEDIFNIINDFDSRKEYGLRGYKYATKYFNKEKNSQNFKKLLEEIS
jgi:predicted site-specific integrase-resolvase